MENAVGLGAAEVIAIAGLFLTIITLALAGVVWIIRLEGRIGALDAALLAARGAHAEQILEVKETNKQLREDIGYIRGRLDQVLAGWAQQRTARGHA